MEGGGAHLGSSLPVSVIHCRRLFSCAGGRLRSRPPFSFVGGRLGSWAVVFVRVCGPSPSFVGGHLCPWAFTFIHGHLCSLVGDRLRPWAVMPFVWCRGGCSCSCVGGYHRGRLCCWWGTVVGSWWGVVASRWCVVVVGPRGCLWWPSRVVGSLLWLRRGSRWCV